MARTKTGVSKKANRLNLEGLATFYTWRAAGIVSGVNDELTADQAFALVGVALVRGKTTTAINLAVALAKFNDRLRTDR